MSRPKRITYILLILALALAHAACFGAVVLQAGNPPAKTDPAVTAKTVTATPNPEKHDKESNPKVTPDAKLGLIAALAGALVEAPLPGLPVSELRIEPPFWPTSAMKESSAKKLRPSERCLT